MPGGENPIHPDASPDADAPSSFDERQAILPKTREQLLAAGESPTILPQTLEEMGRDVGERATIPPSDFATDAAPADSTVFPHIPGYRILKELGKGGMGVVYQAEQVKLHRLVALKMIRGGFVERQEQRQRFLIEAEAVARLHHPNIVQIFEVGDATQADGTFSPFMALEFVAGPSLEDHLQGKPMMPRAAAELVMQLALAMHDAHEHHLIHRDLKPANVLLAPVQDGESKVLQQTELRTRRPGGPTSLPFVPKITDFGLAKQIDANSSHTKAGEIMGTPSYMAPEQAEAKKDLTSSVDTYALGAILYETLTGRPPFRAATSLDTILQVLVDDPVPPSHLQPQTPKDVETICLKCLAKLPAKRYVTSLELAEDLQRYLNYEPILARPTGVVERLEVGEAPPAAAALVAVSTLALVTLVIGGLIFNQMLRQERDVAVVAKKDAQTQRDEARAAQRRADTSATETQKTLDFFAVNTGLRLIEQGELYRGLPWCARPLEETGPYRGPEPVFRERLIQHLHFANRPTLLQQFVTDSGIAHAAFSPDGQWIATAHADRTVRVWEVTTGRLVQTLKDAGESKVTFRPDGKRLLTLASNTAILWDTATWQRAGIARHQSHVHQARFSLDGTTFVTASEDRTARLWSADDARPAGPPMTHDRPVNDVAFFGEGNLVATGCGVYSGGMRASTPGELRLWDTTTGEPHGDALTFPQAVIQVAFSNDGTTAAGASEDGTVRCLDVNTSQPTGPALKAGQSPRKLVFDPSGNKIAVAASDVAVRIWEVSTGRLVQSLTHNDNVWGVEYTRDGKHVVTNSEDKTARVWDVESGKPITPALPHRGTVYSPRWSPSGKQLLTCSDDGTARLWDIASHQVPAIERVHGKGAWSVAISPDGSRAVSAADKELRFWTLPAVTPDGPPLPMLFTETQLTYAPGGQWLAVIGNQTEAHVLKTETRQLAYPPLKHDKRILCLAFSPDGHHVVTGGGDNMVKVWSAHDGKLITTLRHASAVRAVAFSPNGALLLTGGIDGSVHFWDVPTGQPRFPPRRSHRAAVVSADFSPDGQWASTGSSDYTARLWNPKTGEELAPPLQHQYEVTSVAFHPDSRRLLSASFDKTARLWDVTTHRSLGPPLQHQGWVMQAIFSPDGGYAATISRDRTARLWDPDTGQALSPSLPHDGRVVSVCFTPDQRLLMTGGFDPKVRFWPLPTDHRPTSDLIDVIELYDGHRLNKLGGLEQLTNQEVKDRFERLRAKYPDEFKPRQYPK